MKKRYLLIISFFLSIIGILILLIFSICFPPPITKIKNIDYSKSNIIRLYGNIESIKLTKDYKKLTLNDKTGKINIYVPNEINITKNTSIEVLGRLSEYNNNYQIFAEKISYFP